MENATTKPLPPNCDIDVVLPCYNPRDGWVENIVEQFGTLRSLCPGRRLHLIVSNDGSQRNITAQSIEHLLSMVPDSEFIDHPVNHGKGAALRRAVAQSTAPIVLYTDIDFPYQSSCTANIIGLLDQGYDIAIAARNQTYYSELSPLRKVLSWASRTMNRTLLRMKFSDAQGGLKGFNARGREIFLTTKIDRFLFDTEFIRKACRTKGVKIAQIETNLRDGIHLPTMGFKVMRRELINFIRIIFSK